MATAIPPTSGRLRLLGRDPRLLRARGGEIRPPARLSAAETSAITRASRWWSFVEYFALLKEVPAARIPGRGWAAGGRADRARRQGEGEAAHPCPGGMLRRVGVAARRSSTSPSCCLLDEPTAGLDPEQRVAFPGLAARAGRGRAPPSWSAHTWFEDVGAACTQVALMGPGKESSSRAPPATWPSWGEGYGAGDAPLGARGTARSSRRHGHDGRVAAARLPAGFRPVPGAGPAAARAAAAGTAQQTRCCGCCRWPPALFLVHHPTARSWPCRRCGTCAPPAMQTGAPGGVRVAGGRRGRVDGVTGRPPPHHPTW